MKFLSERLDKIRLAYCDNCEEYFIDDVILSGSIFCPNPDCKQCVVRGLTIKDGIVVEAFSGKKFVKDEK